MVALRRHALLFEVHHANPNGGLVVLADALGKCPNLSLDQSQVARGGKCGWLQLDLYTTHQQTEVEASFCSARAALRGTTRRPRAEIWRPLLLRNVFQDVLNHVRPRHVGDNPQPAAARGPDGAGSPAADTYFTLAR